MKKIIYCIFILIIMVMATACENKSIIEDPIENVPNNEEEKENESNKTIYIPQLQSKLIEIGYEETEENRFSKVYNDKIYQFVFFVKGKNDIPSSSVFDLCKKSNENDCISYSFVTEYGMTGSCLYNFKESKNIKGYNCTSQQIITVKDTKNVFESEINKTGINIKNLLSEYINE